jgi:hypothetical protein
MAKKVSKKYVLAVKDYENTMKAVTGGQKVMPKEAEIYKDIFSNVVMTCAEFSCLKKFIKKTKLPKKECMHYWEGLLTLDYTLVLIQYDTEDDNFIETACDNELIKYVKAV